MAAAAAAAVAGCVISGLRGLVVGGAERARAREPGVPVRVVLRALAVLLREAADCLRPPAALRVPAVRVAFREPPVAFRAPAVFRRALLRLREPEDVLFRERLVFFGPRGDMCVLLCMRLPRRSSPKVSEGGRDGSDGKQYQGP
jgi:hypothetical protein